MPTSRFDREFARAAAPQLAGAFGGGARAATYYGLDGDDTTLDHVVLGDERREPRRRTEDGYGTELFLVREGWVIIDSTNPRYCGIGGIEAGGELEVDGVRYAIEQATRGDKLVDFRMSRRELMEIASPEFRVR